MTFASCSTTSVDFVAAVVRAPEAEADSAHAHYRARRPWLPEQATTQYWPEWHADPVEAATPSSRRQYLGADSEPCK